MKKFNIQLFSSGKAPIVKRDRFSKGQCPHNDTERDQIKAVPYSSVVGILMYTQVFTCPDIAFVVGTIRKKAFIDSFSPLR